MWLRQDDRRKIMSSRFIIKSFALDIFSLRYQFRIRNLKLNTLHGQNDFLEMHFQEKFSNSICLANPLTMRQEFRLSRESLYMLQRVFIMKF